VPPQWIREANLKESQNTYLITGTGAASSEASSSGVVKKILNSVSNGYKRSYSYVTTPVNLPVVAFVGGSVITAIGGSDYIFAEANGRTTITTRIVESATNGTYSPDPDTRSKASALRRKGVSLLGCCEPNSRCLDSDLVDSKYEEVKPYEPARYRILEQQNSSLEQQNSSLEQQNSSLEQQNSSLEQQNSSLRGELEKLKGQSKIPDLKETPIIE